eukprot:PITA_30517
MKKFFELHDYIENMKVMIVIFSLKGKENIWWEDVKRVRDIMVEVLSWHEFKRLFRKKYLSKRYYDGKAKELYELKMGSMKYEEYISKFLELLRTKIDYYEKFIECLDDDGEKRILQGMKKPASMRMVTTMQAKHRSRKGCVFFVVHISSDKGKEVEDEGVLKGYLVLQQFQDVFPVDISELPTHREVDFSIELVCGSTPTSKAPYMMSTLELVELKLQLKEMLDKQYIRPSCCLGVHQCCL